MWYAGLTAVVSGDKPVGRDFSGTVVAIGDNVTKYAVGDEVFGLMFEVVSAEIQVLESYSHNEQFGQGCFSEYLNVDPASSTVAIAKNPGCFTPEQAAAIPLVALTAATSLTWLPAATDTQRRVVVYGASGGCGSWTIQCKCP